MFQRDYILRMIEQLAQVMARYMRLKVQEEQKAVLLQLEEFYGKLRLPKAGLLLGMTDRELLTLLSVNGEPDLDKTVSLALVFQEEGRVLENLGRHADSSGRFIKALYLMVTSARLGADVPGVDCSRHIEELRESLRTYRIPPETLVLLADHYESSRRFGQAEDVWFELLETVQSPDLYLEDARAFFGRILELTDEELEQGSLPRTEAEEGRHELERRFG
ncbi:DUF6483 family protein [Gorillibacterium sp. sgz5001074]|uniref:DUF6483 family protein n=1 Tax=Gorillibacterium sp. sgz5001074 TaxID=3446695 RepID=UPI003F66531A